MGMTAPEEQHEVGQLVRSEEELNTSTEQHEAGRVWLRKTVDEETVAQAVPRDVEHAEVERVSVDGADSGQVEHLPDGSFSVPVFEEEIVVTKRLVVRERVIVRKHTVTEEHQIEAVLRKERIEIDA